MSQFIEGTAGVMLVAGGIGVTPVRAMFDVCLRRAYPVTVLYAMRTLQDAAFLTEFSKVGIWNRVVAS